MNLQELKDIIQGDGGKIIIVENDKPELVVMSFEEYRAKIKGKPVLLRGERGEPVQRSEDLSGQDRERADLTIDDLPLS